MNTWFYDEHKHCGIDYSDKKFTDQYDRQHQSFRDYQKEFEGMIDFLGLMNTRESTLIDLGCGTGAMSIYAADKFKKVYSVDVSTAMLEQAEKKVNGASNLTFKQGGFLSYEHREEPADLLITKFAFHHIPDFWKQIALLKMNAMIKCGGILYIQDVVFHFPPTEYRSRIDTWINGFGKSVSEEFLEEFKTHIREEFSTFKWILDGMIRRSGFRIENCRSDDGFVTEYHCVKINELQAQ